MRILINDVAQLTTSAITAGSDKILTPALQDVATDTTYTITCSSTRVNSLAIGNCKYTAASVIRVILYTALGSGTYDLCVSPSSDPFTKLFYFPDLGGAITTFTSIIKVDVIFLTPANFEYVGRIGFGELRDLPIYKSREPGYQSSTQYRETVSGQSVDAAGGFSRRTIGCELKTKIDSNVLADYEKQKYKIAKKLPYFIDFTDEAKWFDSLTYFYAYDDSEVLFQSSMAAKRYSKKFNFREAF